MFINKVVFISWSSANVFEGHAIPEVPGEEVGIQRGNTTNHALKAQVGKEDEQRVLGCETWLSSKYVMVQWEKEQVLIKQI